MPEFLGGGGGSGGDQNVRVNVEVNATGNAKRELQATAGEVRKLISQMAQLGQTERQTSQQSQQLARLQRDGLEQLRQARQRVLQGRDVPAGYTNLALVGAGAGSLAGVATTAYRPVPTQAGAATTAYRPVPERAPAPGLAAQLPGAVIAATIARAISPLQRIAPVKVETPPLLKVGPLPTLRVERPVPEVRVHRPTPEVYVHKPVPTMPVANPRPAPASAAPHAAGGAMPSYATGGYVPRTGPAYLHQGEYVVPAHLTGGGETPMEKADRLLHGLATERAAKQAKMDARKQFRSTVTKLASEVFGGDVALDGNTISLQSLGRCIYLEMRPGGKNVLVDFTQRSVANPSAKQDSISGWGTTAAQLQGGSVDLLHKFREFITYARGLGIGIAYETEDSRRHRVYGKMLKAAGYGLAKGSENTGDYLWRPVDHLRHGGDIPAHLAWGGTPQTPHVGGQYWWNTPDAAGRMPRKADLKAHRQAAAAMGARLERGIPSIEAAMLARLARNRSPGLAGILERHAVHETPTLAPQHLEAGSSGKALLHQHLAALSPALIQQRMENAYRDPHGNAFAPFYGLWQKKLARVLPQKRDRELFNAMYAAQSHGADDDQVIVRSIQFMERFRQFRGSGQEHNPALYQHIIGRLGLWDTQREGDVAKILEAHKEGLPLAGVFGNNLRKRQEYIRALTGDPLGVAVDEHLTHVALGAQPGEGLRKIYQGNAKKPQQLGPGKHYDKVRSAVVEAAAQLGVEPRAVQAAAFGYHTAGAGPPMKERIGYLDELRSTEIAHEVKGRRFYPSLIPLLQRGGQIPDHLAWGGIPDAYKAVSSRTAQLKEWMEKRYGKAGAAAILGSGQAVGWGAMGLGTLMTGTPWVVPGGSLLGALPALGIAEMLHRLRGAKHKAHGGPIHAQHLAGGKKVRPTFSIDEKKIGKSLEKLVGGSGPEHWDELAGLVGAPAEAEVEAMEPAGGKGILVYVKHPVYMAKRLIGIDSAKKKFIENKEFWMNESAQGGGLGTHVFASAVANARKHGFAYMKAHAAKVNPTDLHKPHAGYYTWPRLGYDQAIKDLDLDDPDDFLTRDRAMTDHPHARSILDIMATPDGRKWWQQHGTDLLHARFDLGEGSRSLSVLRGYLAEPGVQEKLKKSGLSVPHLAGGGTPKMDALLREILEIREERSANERRHRFLADVHGLTSKAFGTTARLDKFGHITVSAAGRQIGLDPRPASMGRPPRAFVQFSQDGDFASTGKDLQGGSIDLLHGFRHLVGGLHGLGIDVSYQANDARRVRVYAKLMRGAGFEQGPCGDNDPENYALWHSSNAHNYARGGQTPDHLIEGGNVLWDKRGTDTQPAELPGGYVVNAQAAAANRGLLKRLGSVTVPDRPNQVLDFAGGGRSGAFPAMLTPREEWVPDPAASRARPLLDRINAGHMAGGGRVPRYLAEGSGGWQQPYAAAMSKMMYAQHQDALSKGATSQRTFPVIVMGPKPLLVKMDDVPGERGGGKGGKDKEEGGSWMDKLKSKWAAVATAAGIVAAAFYKTVDSIHGMQKAEEDAQDVRHTAGERQQKLDEADPFFGGKAKIDYHREFVDREGARRIQQANTNMEMDVGYAHGRAQIATAALPMMQEAQANRERADQLKRMGPINKARYGTETGASLPSADMFSKPWLYEHQERLMPHQRERATAELEAGVAKKTHEQSGAHVKEAQAKLGKLKEKEKELSKNVNKAHTAAGGEDDSYGDRAENAIRHKVEQSKLITNLEQQKALIEQIKQAEQQQMQTGVAAVQAESRVRQANIGIIREELNLAKQEAQRAGKVGLSAAYMNPAQMAQAQIGQKMLKGGAPAWLLGSELQGAVRQAGGDRYMDAKALEGLKGAGGDQYRGLQKDFGEKTMAEAQKSVVEWQQKMEMNIHFDAEKTAEGKAMSMSKEQVEELIKTATDKLEAEMRRKFTELTGGAK